MDYNAVIKNHTFKYHFKVMGKCSQWDFKWKQTSKQYIELSIQFWMFIYHVYLTLVIIYFLWLSTFSNPCKIVLLFIIKTQFMFFCLLVFMVERTRQNQAGWGKYGIYHSSREGRLNRVWPVLMAFSCSTLKPGGRAGREKGQTWNKQRWERP